MSRRHYTASWGALNSIFARLGRPERVPSPKEGGPIRYPCLLAARACTGEHVVELPGGERLTIPHLVGGPRPNSGGRRKGAGRPPGSTAEPTRIVSVRMPVTLADAFAARWGKGWQERLRNLMRGAVEAGAG